MGRPGQRVGVPMKSALPVLDGEVDAGKDLQPSQNHPGGDSRDRIQVSARLSVRKMNGLCKR